MPLSTDELISKLHSETAKISWLELQRFFAQGKVLQVADKEDLLLTASYLAADDAEMVKRMLAQHTVAPVSDEQAREWFNAGAELWSVVVAPFVLVQACLDQESS